VVRRLPAIAGCLLPALKGNVCIFHCRHALLVCRHLLSNPQNRKTRDRPTHTGSCFREQAIAASLIARFNQALREDFTSAHCQPPATKKCSAARNSCKTGVSSVSFSYPLTRCLTKLSASWNKKQFCFWSKLFYPIRNSWPDSLMLSIRT